MKSSFLVLLFLVLVHPLVAATDTNGDGFITVLIPIAFSPNQILAGTYETQWTGELWAHNATGVDIASLQPYSCEIPMVSVTDNETQHVLIITAQ